MSDTPVQLSALLVVHNEEKRLRPCLERLTFCDEIVVVLDRCTDGTRAIAEEFGCRLLEGGWPIEGDRRNAGNALCRGEWILEMDADEWLSAELAVEIRETIANPDADYYLLPVDNYIGERCVRYGWGAQFGTASVSRLCRKGIKTWGSERVHPSLIWADGARKGRRLTHRITHFVDTNISDMIRRFDSYTTARAMDLVESGKVGSTLNNTRRIVSRFWRCFVSRKGYREGGYGFLIATFAALYPMVSHLKALYEEEAIRAKIESSRKS
ncbi:glycosyltransferase family 2 protein [Kiloniella sp. b19]|uniref:glycosyltransferase family 2 protein n=1 Tax=Kiloniella sp. GXU_MW_B19 TaxID=3141326 RepID=UPI0031DFA42D